MYPVLFVSGNSVTALFSGTPGIPEGGNVERETPLDLMGVVVNAMIAWDCWRLFPSLSIPVSTGSIFMFVVLCFLSIIQR